MKINNGFNILPWYDSLEKQHQKKWYAYGQSWPLLCPQGTILPFQFISDTAISISSNIYAINTETGSSFDLGVKPVVTEITYAGSTYYIVKLTASASKNIPVGKYNLRMATSEGYLYSEEITIIDNIIDCIKVEYWNEETLRFTAGEINFEDNFRFIFYINSTIGKPEYEFEEELTKRLGYKFIESQTSNKIYKFSFVAPEYICDAMRLIRMCDFIKLTTKYDSYNALSLSYEPKWQEQGDLASVDVEFETDCIIQKLESFNRRIKESFYNALLSDIEEPILFSSDTVAQYYTEYTSVSYINGKLIRQLEAISEKEIDEEIENLVLPIDNQANEEDSKAKKIFLHDILKRSNSGLDKLFKGHYDESGKLLWIETLAHLGVNGGVTMFIDNASLDLPSIYDGLPIDGDTIYWELDENGKKLRLKAKVDEGALTLGGLLNVGEWADQVPVTDRIMVQKAGSEVWESMDIANIGTASFENIEEYGEGNAFTSFLVTTEEKGEKLYLIKDKTFVEKSYLEDNYFTIDEASGLFVTLDKTVQIIQGVKFFSEGLYIGLSKIWQSQDDVIYLDANLVVRGSVTMYAQENVDIPSFMESLLLDKNTLKLDENGYLTVIGGSGGSIEHALTWSGFSSGSYDGKSARNIYIPSKVSELTNDSAFITKSALSGYATESWVKNQGYALASALGNYLPITGGTITGSLTVNGDFSSGGTGNFSKYLTCRGSLNISGESGVNTSINFYSYDQSGYQFSNRVYEDKALRIYYRSAAGAFTEVMKIGSDGLTKMTSYYAYPLSLKRTNPNGGAYIKFFAKNQEILSMSAGTDSLHRFSVWYQDTSQNIDKYVMWIDSNGNMLTYGGITMYSDERKKTILRHVELSLKEVADAPLVEHYYNSDDKKTTHVGSIAQYWAGLNDWFCKKDDDGFYTMEIQNAALASAISVAREVVRLKEHIRELEKEIEQLKNK